MYNRQAIKNKKQRKRKGEKMETKFPKVVIKGRTPYKNAKLRKEIRQIIEEYENENSGSPFIRISGLLEKKYEEEQAHAK